MGAVPNFQKLPFQLLREVIETEVYLIAQREQLTCRHILYVRVHVKVPKRQQLGKWFGFRFTSLTLYF